MPNTSKKVWRCICPKWVLMAIKPTPIIRGSALIGHRACVDTVEITCQRKNESSDFPRQCQYPTLQNSFYDAFITKLSADGQTSCIHDMGGSGDDILRHSCGFAGYALLAGLLIQWLPTDQPYSNVGNDGFVTKWSPEDDSSLRTYLGGVITTVQKVLQWMLGGNALVAGDTQCYLFPTVNNVYPQWEAMMMRSSQVSADGQTLYSHFLEAVPWPCWRRSLWMLRQHTGTGVRSKNFPTANAIFPFLLVLTMLCYKFSADGQLVFFSTYSGREQFYRLAYELR